jgi:ADP-heptose:LPS heptosyltransferase
LRSAVVVPHERSERGSFPPSKILLARAGALGDVVLLRRAIARLVAAGHRPSLLAPAAPAAALVGPGEVDEVLPWDGAETAALLAGERTGGPVESAVASADLVIAYTRSAPVLDALGPRARLLVHRDPAPPAAGPHASIWLAGALETLGLRAAADPEPLRFTPAETAEAEVATSGLPPRFLAVHPGSGSPGKNWPFLRFAEAAARLTGGQPWLLVLGPAEDELLAGGAAPAPVLPSPGPGPAPRGAVVARGLPLRRLAAILARAGLFIGNDSGASHLAAACGAPTLALFGPTDPALWSPVGRAVRTLRPPGRRLDDLGVDEVVDAAGRLRS